MEHEERHEDFVWRNLGMMLRVLSRNEVFLMRLFSSNGGNPSYLRVQFNHAKVELIIISHNFFHKKSSKHSRTAMKDSYLCIVNESVRECSQGTKNLFSGLTDFTACPARKNGCSNDLKHET